MPVSAPTLRLLMDAGLGGDALVAVVASIDADNVPARSTAAERQARYRDRKRDVTSDVTEPVTPPPDKETSPTPPKEINPSEPIGSGSFDAREFDEFWSAWPDKRGRKKAEAAFRTARKREDLETILDGVRRYASTKPADRHWMLATTFLNGERWNDEPDNPPAHNGKSRPHDAIFRALAEQAQTGPGRDQWPSDPHDRDGAERAGAGRNSGPDIDLEAAAFRRAS